MTFTSIFVMIFLIAFVLIGGFVLFLSKTIDHGEARFDADGRVISNKPKQSAADGPARPAQKTDTNKADGNE